MNMLVLMLPGVSVTYQGEELGMTNTNISWEDTLDPAGLACGHERYQECSRDPERTPMQWSSHVNAGFSSANKTWLPVNPNYLWLNVESQLGAEDVHNTHIGVYRDAMKIRNRFKDRSDTSYEVMDNIFLALNRDWKIILNFNDVDMSINLSSILVAHQLPVGLVEVAARSVNGSSENSVGQVKDLHSNVYLSSKSALLLVDLY